MPTLVKCVCGPDRALVIMSMVAVPLVFVPDGSPCRECFLIIPVVRRFQ